MQHLEAIVLFESINKNFMSDFAGALVAHCTLRLLKPECEIDAEWTGEDLDHQVQRVIKKLYSIIYTSQFFGVSFSYRATALSSLYFCMVFCSYPTKVTSSYCISSVDN